MWQQATTFIVYQAFYEFLWLMLQLCRSGPIYKPSR